MNIEGHPRAELMSSGGTVLSETRRRRTNPAPLVVEYRYLRYFGWRPSRIAVALLPTLGIHRFLARVAQLQEREAGLQGDTGILVVEEDVVQALEFTLECAISWGVADGADLSSDEFAVHNLALSAGTDPLPAVAS
jgi:hypothetical protein